MRIAIIGIVAGAVAGTGCGSYCYRMAAVMNHKHTAFDFPTQSYRIHDPDGLRIVYPISTILGDKVDEIEAIIVVQSRIMITNDTDIPLILFKTESVEPYLTVYNPTYVIKKLEYLQDYDTYEYTIPSAIALNNYNPNREKDILLADIPWLPLPFDIYVERLERAQHMIIMSRYHNIDTFTARATEAMACKTIPIIFYSDPNTKRLYESVGITEEVAYFVSTSNYCDLQIKEYDVDMANRGYELVKEKFNMRTHVNKFLEILENA